jgi:hypothetical protein
MQLYAIGDDRLVTSAAGAGAGAAVGTGAGVVAGGVIGCAGLGPLALPCWGAVVAAGAVVGGAGGAVAGAMTDPDDPIDAAPVHLYAVNEVLPDLSREYLSAAIIEDRALKNVRSKQMPIDFVPAAWNGQRYTAADPGTDVNLILTAMVVTLTGKAADDPKVSVAIGMQWTLTKYDAETQNDDIWDAWSVSHESKKRRLSKWLDDDGALLKAELDTGIDKALSAAFSEMPSMAKR